MSCFSITFTQILKRVCSSTIQRTLSKSIALSVFFSLRTENIFKTFQIMSRTLETFLNLILMCQLWFSEKICIVFFLHSSSFSEHFTFFQDFSKQFFQKFFKFFFSIISFTKFYKDSSKGRTEILSRIYEWI